MYNGQDYCTNQEYCLDTTRNQTFKCPLWQAYCGPLQKDKTTNSTQNGLADVDRQRFIHLCNYFNMTNSVKLRHGIPGISNSRPTLENYKPNYIDEGEVYPGEVGVNEVEIVGKEFTSFLILIGIYLFYINFYYLFILFIYLLGIYFPSVTGKSN